MFSSNQIFEVSGDMTQLQSVLEFALELSGHEKNMTKKEIDRGCKLLYQITEDGKYCIGWGLNRIPDGWHEYPFDFDTSIVAQIIIQHLRKQPRKESPFEYADGSTSDGFLAKAVVKTFGDYQGIKNAFYGIVSFEPYINYYAK